MIYSTCNTDKEITEFYKRESARDGYRKQCSKCLQAKVRTRRVVGIYKITSPTGRVYIGQSVDIKTRWASYRSNCSKQVKLYNSFKKYGIHKHIFEIKEECREDELTEKELYWQKYYDCVEKGLNCGYVSLSYDIMNKRNNINPKKESLAGIIREGINDILDIETGVFYYGFADVDRYYDYSRGIITDMLKGDAFNNTSLILSEDYENGKIPMSLLKDKTKFNRKFGCQNDFIVIDFSTKEELGAIKNVAKVSNIKETTLRSYLTGIANNPTDYIFKKDYISGLTPKDLCSNIVQKTKVINFETGEIFNSFKDVAEKYGVHERTIYQYIKDREISRLPIIKLSDYKKEEAQKQPTRDILRINRKIIDVKTEEVFTNFKEVSNRYNISTDMVSKYLNCKCFNKIGIIFKDEYDKGLLPNHSFEGKGINTNKEIVDITTGIEYKSIREACRDLNLSNVTIAYKLKNNNVDGISLRYKNKN